MSQLTDDDLRRQLQRRSARPAPPWLEAAITERIEQTPQSAGRAARWAWRSARLSGWSDRLGQWSALVAAAAAVVIVLAGAVVLLRPALIGLAPSATSSPSPTASVPPLSVANGTTVPVTISVNGVVIVTVPADTTEDPIHAALPARPWTIEAHSPGGRLLATLTVTAQDHISANSGLLARQDLSCGRLDIWSGPRPLGPPPSLDPSKPCDGAPSPTPTSTGGTTYHYPGPIPPLSRTCDGSEAAGRVTFQAGAVTDIPGEQVGRLTVWLTGGEPCWLEGFPEVTLLDRSGKPLAVQAAAYPGSEPPALLLPGLGEPDVADNGGPFGQSASAFLGWFDWCGPPVDGGLVSVQLRPGGTPFTLSADLKSPTCIAHSESSSLDVGRFVMASAPPADLALPSPTPMPSAGRSCTAADLSLRFDPYVPRPDAAGGGHGADLTVWDRGSTPCDLQGVPDVSFIDASGRTFGPAVTPDGSPTPLVTLLPGLGEPSLATAGIAGSAATTNVLWQPDCGTRITGSTLTAVLHFESGTLQVRILAPEPICPSPSPGFEGEPLIVSAWAPGWLP